MFVCLFSCFNQFKFSKALKLLSTHVCIQLEEGPSTENCVKYQTKPKKLNGHAEKGKLLPTLDLRQELGGKGRV